MTSAKPAQPQTAPPPRVKKRMLIPLILLALIVGVTIAFFIRGTWANDALINPTHPDAGTVTQLFRKNNGNVVVRCAVAVDAPPKVVWATINDYGSHHEFLPYVTSVEATKQKDGKIKVDGVAYSRLWQDWPFEALVTNKENAKNGVYSATWSQHDEGVFVFNRGGWEVSPLDDTKKQTLLVFTLQVELKDYPDFVVRNIIMDRLHNVLKAMRDESQRRAGTAPA